MSLGIYSNYLGEVIRGDNVLLKNYLEVLEQPVTSDQITSATYTVQYPAIDGQVNNAIYTVPFDTISFTGIDGITDAGTVYITTNLGVELFQYTGVEYNELTGTVTITGVTGGTDGAVIQNSANANFSLSTTISGEIQNDGAATYLWEDTSTVGPYVATCQFSLVTGERRSVFCSFTVIDPFNPVDPTPIEQITEQVWMRLSDLFDSTDGGPWLRDRTMNYFNQDKIAQFIPESLFDINVQMPPTNFTIADFTTPPGTDPGMVNPNFPLLVKGVLCLTIRHLMRSYTEIYTPTGQGQLVWADRTRYQQAWGQIYEIEYQDFIAATRLAKRQTLGLGTSALLTLSKAGRLYPYTNFSTRGIWRGYA